MQPEPWVNIPSCAKRIGVSKETIYRLLKAKGIPAYRVGKLWRFKLSEIDSWILKKEK